MTIKVCKTNERAQVISTDLLVSLIVVTLAMGLSVQALGEHYRQAASTFEGAKMHQIALDAAAINYYKGMDGEAAGYDGLDVSAEKLGYTLADHQAPLSSSCVVSSRGTGAHPTVVYVCR
ncbi:MAG: hypothetical protein J7L23_00475 [Candidatus Diapherotrites archaeon]|nr:hypothetical protein [Candidatus Diapherotrites archaeon]